MGPSEPRLGSHVSLGPGIRPFWGAAGGHFVSWTPLLLVRDPTDKTTVLAVTRRHRRACGIFWFLVLPFTGFWRGLGTEKKSGPQPTKRFWTPQKSEKKVDFFSVAVSENLFTSKTEQFFLFFESWCTVKKQTQKKLEIFFRCGFKKCDFFVFGPWCPLQEPCALKTLSRFRASGGAASQISSSAFLCF